MHASKLYKVIDQLDILFINSFEHNSLYLHCKSYTYQKNKVRYNQQTSANYASQIEPKFCYFTLLSLIWNEKKIRQINPNFL